jgi:hypothetical protein
MRPRVNAITCPPLGNRRIVRRVTAGCERLTTDSSHARNIARRYVGGPAKSTPRSGASSRSPIRRRG